MNNFHFRFRKIHGNGIGKLNFPRLAFIHQLIDKEILGDGNVTACSKPGMYGADGNAALFRKPSACFAVSPEPFLDSEFFRVTFFRIGRWVRSESGIRPGMMRESAFWYWPIFYERSSVRKKFAAGCLSPPPIDRICGFGFAATPSPECVYRRQT